MGGDSSMKEMEEFITNLLKDVSEMVFGNQESECPSDEYGNTWQSRARRLEKTVRALEGDLNAFEVDLLATRGEREYYKSRVDVLNAEIDILNAEVARLEAEASDNRKPSTAMVVTEEPSPFIHIVLVDRDGDQWSQQSTIAGLKWHCSTVAMASPRTFDELNEDFGPLTILEHRTK